MAITGGTIMPGKAVIVVSFPEPEDDMELGAIIQTLKDTFADRDDGPELKMYMGVNNVADRVIDIFAPLSTPVEPDELENRRTRRERERQERRNGGR